MNAQIAAAVQGRVVRGIEDDFLRIESRVPAFGGMFVDSLGTVVVYATDPQSSVTATQEVRVLLDSLQIPASLRNSLANDDAVRVRIGRYRFSDLVSWQMRLVPLLRSQKGFIAIDADESSNTVRIDIDESASAAGFYNLASVVGIPNQALTIRPTGSVQPLASLRDTWRPTGAGVQINTLTGLRCTLGWNVKTTLGETGFLTASHCDGASPGSGYVGGTIYQPAAFLDIGTITINPTWNSAAPECGSYTLCPYSDVMFVAYNNTANWSSRVMKTASVGTNYSGGSISVTGAFTNIAGTVGSTYVGASVDKIGRTTGWTRGTVQGTCEYVVVDSATANPKLYQCVTRLQGSRLGIGDSGGPVFLTPAGTASNTPIWALGIVSAGGTMNAFDTDGTPFCSSNCKLYFTPWSRMNTHLSRTLTPW